MNIKLLWIALVAAVAMGCAKTPENRSSFAGNEEAAYSATADASQAVADVSAAPIPQQVTSQRVATSTPASQQEAAYQYVIGPGDTLDVFVWGYKDLSVTIPVRPDGKITTRLVEDMVASGKTVTVNKFIGVPSQQVKVVGGGAKPRTVPYVNGMTVLDVMIEVGGLKKFSSGNKAVLVRTVNGERKSYRVRLHDLLKKGDIKANGYVQPGDIIIIPESWF